MGSYRAWRGGRTGATMWQVVADGGDLRVLPDAAMDLVWFENRLQFAGADTTAARVTTSAGAVATGLRLPPGTAHALLGVSAHELADRRVNLCDLAEIPGSVAETAYTDPAAALEQAFVALWRHAAPDRENLRLAASLDASARAGAAVADVAAEHGLSDRALRRISDRLFGYGPKTLMSVHRFQTALCLARSGMSFASASATAGYADQSHLNRAARRLAGTTPTALLA